MKWIMISVLFHFLKHVFVIFKHGQSERQTDNTKHETGWKHQYFVKLFIKHELLISVEFDATFSFYV